MDTTLQSLIEKLNDPELAIRLDSLRQLMAAVREGVIEKPVAGNDVNNHIHTTYSFSPYSPTRAVWESYRAGLQSAGIMDHDSIGGALEFSEAGAIAGLATTIGLECRTDFSKTPFNGRRINNPDQLSNAYIALHGIPHQHIGAFADYFRPYIAARQRRNRAMVDRINAIITSAGFSLDYDRDVVPLSRSKDGGTVAERHILYALAMSLVGKLGRGEQIASFIEKKMGIPLAEKERAYLSDAANRFYEHDLLGIFKKDLVPQFFIEATDECPEIRDVLSFAKGCHCICAYAYLGDVGQSATGDKKTQKFEDDYLDELMECVRDLGFNAVTYMPSRNRPDQLERIMSLCRQHGFLQISGEDINSPRQPFVCHAMRSDTFAHLVDATWALIGHELAATADISDAFFHPHTVARYPELDKRIAVYRDIGMRSKSARN